MAIRRFRDHVAEQNWFAVLIDLVIVVVGVFLGLQVNNWNNDRLERKEVADYRGEIIGNLRANEISLRDQIAYYRKVNDHAVAALAVLDGQTGDPGEAFILDSYQATQIRQRQLTQTAYDEMKSAGIGHLIADEKTRALLSSYYAQLPQLNDTALTITVFRDRVRSLIPHSIQRRIRDECGDKTVSLPLGVVGSSLTDRCELGLSDPQIERTVALLRSAPGLGRDLTRRIADVDSRIGALNVLLERARHVRGNLEAIQGA